MAITIQSRQWESGEVISATKLNAMVNDITAFGTSTNNLEEKVTTKALTVQGALETTSDSVDIKKATNIAGTTTITGDFEVKSSNSTILKAENASNILKVSIPNQLIVGTANTKNDTTTYTGTAIFNTETTQIYGTTTIDTAHITGAAEVNGNLTVGTTNTENNITTYAGTAIFNTATTSIHGDTSIANLTVDNKINELTIGDITSDTITNSGDFTVGTATTTIVADEEVTTYSGEAVFNTTKLTAHGNTIVDTLKTIDNADIEGILTVGTTSANKQFNVYGGTTITGSATIGGSNTITNLQGRTNIANLHTNGPAYLQSLIVGSVGVDLGTPSTIYTDLEIGNSSASKNVTIYGAANINSLTLNAAENSLIVGTAGVTNGAEATGQTILHGSTTIDNLVIGTAEIREIGENNEEQITPATGRAVLHGSIEIDNLHAGQLVSGTPPEYNELNEMTKEPEGSTTLYGTTIVNALQAETLDVDIFNGVEIPSLPIDEDSPEEVKPYKDGEYMLKLTITDGQPSYSWVAIGGAEP